MKACLKCGECCCRFIIEPHLADVKREPRIAKVAKALRYGRWRLACCDPCPFLKLDKTCEIYATRPSECRDFEPGDCWGYGVNTIDKWWEEQEADQE